MRDAAAVDRELFWKLTNVMRRLPVHRGDDGDLVRPHGRLAQPAQVIGGWYIWISFAVAVGKRVPLDSFYWQMAVLILAIAVVRLIAMFRRGRRRVTFGAQKVPG